MPESQAESHPDVAPSHLGLAQNHPVLVTSHPDRAKNHLDRPMCMAVSGDFCTGKSD